MKWYRYKKDQVIDAVLGFIVLVGVTLTIALTIYAFGAFLPPV